MEHKTNVKIFKDMLKKKKCKMVNVMLSGAHLFGFESGDSDLDYRGFHVMKTEEFFRLQSPRDVVEYVHQDIDYVSFELKKAVELIIKNNGNVIEQVFAKQIFESALYKELKELTKKVISKRIYHHYRGLATQNYKKYILTESKSYKAKSVKKYLYVIRALLIGIHVMRTGKVEPNIVKLNKKYKFPHVNKLVELKKKGKEFEDKLSISEKKKVEALIENLYKKLDKEFANSKLLEEPKNVKDFEKFLMKARRKYY